MSAAAPPENIAPPSPLRAWLFLVAFSFRRQMRVKQMVGIAVGLLAICLLLVGSFTASSGWDRYEWRINRVKPFTVEHVAGGLAHAAIDQSEYMDRVRQETKPLAVFSRWVVFLLFLGFLMPLFSLSFGTAALGQEREGRSLVWLMTRPLPRSAIYLAKLLGVLPWCLALTVGGFGVLCLAGGETGRRAFMLYAPGVFGGTLAFAALFHLFGAIFQRPAIVSLLYAFFFETMLSELPIPGTLKRLSINYYTRCLLYSAAETQDVPIESSSLFVPVSPTVAWIVLMSATIAITALGMWLFRAMSIGMMCEGRSSQHHGSSQEYTIHVVAIEGRKMIMSGFLESYSITEDSGNSPAPDSLAQALRKEFCNCIGVLGGRTFNHGLYRLYRWDEII